MSPEPIVFLHSHFAQQQWSEELRFISLAESTWRGSLGLFFSNNVVDADQTRKVLQNSQNLQIRKQDEVSYAMFGQISYQGIDALRFFLDLRLDYVEKK